MSISTTTSRTELVDFTHPANYVPVSYLIPKPASVANMLAVAQPFDTLVYLIDRKNLLTIVSFKSKIRTWPPFEFFGDYDFSWDRIALTTLILNIF